MCHQFETNEINKRLQKLKAFNANLQTTIICKKYWKNCVS